MSDIFLIFYLEVSIFHRIFALEITLLTLNPLYYGRIRQHPRSHLLPLAATYLDLKKQIESLKDEVNDILADQNDINESTRAQLDAISTALAEMQAKSSTGKPRRPIGFIQPEDKENS